MTDPDFIAASLERALSVVGLDGLAARLNVSPRLVRAWLQGQAEIPERTFLLLLDLLLDVSPSEPLPDLR
jgi:transcriptional regulator with XRE-family HTH domain